MNFKNIKKLGIRVSTDVNSGKGHLVRCIAIRRFIQHRVVWFIDSEDEDTVDMIPSKDEVFIECSVFSCHKIIKAIKNKYVHLVLLDSHNISSNDQLRIKKNISLAVISDTAEKMNADLIIYPHPISYKFSTDTKFLGGIKYASVNKEFLKKYKNSDYLKEEINILVSMGYIDKAGVTVKAIKALNRILRKCSYNLKILIVVGESSPIRLHIKSLINQIKNYDVLVNPDDMGVLYSKSSLAIGAPGQSHIERLVFGLPTILVAQNKIHKLLIPEWEKLGCSIKAENTVSSLYTSIKFLLSNKKILNNMRKRSKIIIDGLGASRVASNLNEMF